METLENIYANLETIEQTIAQLADDTRKDIDVTDYSEFCLAVNDILGYDNTAYTDMASTLGINPGILNKFLKFRGKVPTHTARTIPTQTRAERFPMPRRPTFGGITEEPARRTGSPVDALPAPTQKLTFPERNWRRSLYRRSGPLCGIQ